MQDTYLCFELVGADREDGLFELFIDDVFKGLVSFVVLGGDNTALD